MIWNLNTAALLVPLLFLLTGLTITVAIDPYISRKHRRVMGIIIVLSFTLIVQNIVEDYVVAGEPRWFLQTTLAVYGYTLRPVFLVLFLYIVRPERSLRLCGRTIMSASCCRIIMYFYAIYFEVCSEEELDENTLRRPKSMGTEGYEAQGQGHQAGRRHSWLP